MGFDNISLAINGQQNNVNRDLEDYNLFDRLRKEGRSLQDIVRQAEEAEALRKQMDEMGRTKPRMDAAVFSLMEEYVRDDPEVAVARNRLLDMRNAIISELCMKDNRYRGEFESYRNTVQERYVKAREGIAQTGSLEAPDTSEQDE